MSGIYRKFTINGVTDNQVNAFTDAVQAADTRGVAAWSVSYDPSTQVAVLDVGIDPEALPSGITAGILRTQVRTWFQNQFGRLPDFDVSRNVGDDGMTGRDRTRQFIDAWNNNTDPATIGIHGPDLAERRRRLRDAMEASRRAWNL